MVNLKNIFCFFAIYLLGNVVVQSNKDIVCELKRYQTYVKTSSQHLLILIKRGFSFSFLQPMEQSKICLLWIEWQKIRHFSSMAFSSQVDNKK